MPTERLSIGVRFADTILQVRWRVSVKSVFRTSKFPWLMSVLLSLVFVAAACRAPVGESTSADSGAAEPSQEVMQSPSDDSTTEDTGREEAESPDDSDGSKNDDSTDSSNSSDNEAADESADTDAAAQSDNDDSSSAESAEGGSLLAQALAFSADASSFGFEGKLEISGIEQFRTGFGGHYVQRLPRS